jgi:hypothetical protein
VLDLWLSRLLAWKCRDILPFSLFPASHRFLVSFSTKTWISDAGERKDFEVYSCDVSLDGSRLVSAAGGEWILIAGFSELSYFPLFFFSVCSTSTFSVYSCTKNAEAISDTMVLI